MKKLVKGALFLALVGTAIIGCEKEESIIQPVQNNNDIEVQKSKVTSLKSNSDYPIIINEDLTIEENLIEVIINLNEGEVLY